MLRLLVLLYYYHKKKKKIDKSEINCFTTWECHPTVEKSPWLPLAISGQ